jgi:hypothetical protein
MSINVFVKPHDSIEHIIPLAEGGTDEEENLWLACPICNGHKANKITGIDAETGETVPYGIRIIGFTPVGRATVTALHLSDDPDALRVRSHWIIVGWHPPED